MEIVGKLFEYRQPSMRKTGVKTKRHDAICDKFYDYCLLARLDVKKEQRYKDDGTGGKIRVQGRSGDIKIINYFTTTSISKDCNKLRFIC